MKTDQEVELKASKTSSMKGQRLCPRGWQSIEERIRRKNKGLE